MDRGEGKSYLYPFYCAYLCPRWDVAIHPRDYTPGGYSTIPEHLCSTHQHYLKRSPAYYMQRAEQVSAPLLQLIQCLFDGGRPPEQNYRTCDGLLNIYRKTTPEIFNTACKMALDYKCYSYRYMLNMVERYKSTVYLKQKQRFPYPFMKTSGVGTITINFH